MIWVATDDGLRRLDPSTSKLNCYQHRQNDISSIASDLVKAVLESRNGTLWVATTLGLEAFDPGTGKTSGRVTLRGPSGASLSLDGNKEPSSRTTQVSSGSRFLVNRNAAGFV